MDPKSTAVVFIEYQNDFTTEAARQGTWGAQIVDALKPEPGDIVIEGSGAWTASPPPISISSCEAVAYRPSRLADS